MHCILFFLNVRNLYGIIRNTATLPAVTLEEVISIAYLMEIGSPSVAVFSGCFTLSLTKNKTEVFSGCFTLSRAESKIEVFS